MLYNGYPTFRECMVVRATAVVLISLSQVGTSCFLPSDDLYGGDAVGRHGFFTQLHSLHGHSRS